MPASALGLALAAALVHALWNLLLAGARDSQASTAVGMCVGCLLFLPALTGHIESGVWPYVAASAALELLYFALLALAYSRYELSAVYPLARGSAPVFVLLVGGVSLLLQGVGVVLIGCGVLLVRGLRRGDLRETMLALAVGASIAGYTLVDKHGLDHADPLPYLELVLVVPALAYACFIGRERLRPAVDWRAGLAGLGMFGAYAFTLAALRLAAAAPVAAVRETSIVIATLLGAVVLHEAVGRARHGGRGGDRRRGRGDRARLNPACAGNKPVPRTERGRLTWEQGFVSQQCDGSSPRLSSRWRSRAGSAGRSGSASARCPRLRFRRRRRFRRPRTCPPRRPSARHPSRPSARLPCRP